MSDLWRLTAHEAHEKLRSKEFSSVELTQSVIDRINEVESKVHAYITTTPELALEQAKEADARYANGTATPLTGIPVGVKDLIVTKGTRTTAGSKILENFIPPYDSHVYEQLRKAGAVMVGKANLDEFAMGSSTEHSAYGTTHNPWNLDLVPGGSSGGSAAAVSAGECLVSLGSDTGGSIRQPSAFCGVVGLDPTYGRVSRFGIVAFGSSLDQVGPIGRDVEDVATMLQCIGGHDPRDSTSNPEPMPDMRHYLGREIKGMKIGVPREYFISGMEPGVKARIDEALKTLESLGAEIDTSLSLPEHRTRPRRLLHHRPQRSLREPRPLRRREVRLQRPLRPHHVGQYGADPRPGLRQRSEAPHHARHLRALGWLLRRLLPEGPEGAHRHQQRVRGRLREVRRHRHAHHADRCLPHRRQSR